MAKKSAAAAAAGKGIQIKRKGSSPRGRRETVQTMNGIEETVVARKPAAGAGKPTVLRGENAAKVKGDSHDALKASRVLIAAAYGVAGDVVSIQPHFGAFGEGVPVDMAVGISIGSDGKAVVKVTCRVDGREVELEG